MPHIGQVTFGPEGPRKKITVNPPRSYIPSGDGLRPPTWTPEMESRILSIEADVRSILERNNLPINPMSLSLEKLPRQDRNRILGELSEVYQLGATSSLQGVGHILPGESSSYYADRIAPDHPVDISSIWYEQHYKSIQRKALTANVAVEDIVRPSGNQKSLHAMKILEKQINEGIPQGSSAILDLETSGLDPEHGLIWQMTKRGSDGLNETLHFKNPLMGMGTIGQETLENYVLSGKNISDFSEIKPFLRSLLDYDVISGQNIGFDLNFLVSNLRHLSGVSGDARKRGLVGKDFDPELADIADALEKRLSSTSVVDTLALGRHYMPLDLSDELETMASHHIGRGTPMSMQNVLLQSNLMEIIAEQGGLEEAYTHLSEEGLHDSAADTFFEQFYHNELEKMNRGEASKLRALPKGTRFNVPDISVEENLMLRRHILEGGALTPYTQMGYEHLDPVVLEALKRSKHADRLVFENLDMGLDHPMNFVRLNPVEHAAIQSRYVGSMAAPGADTIDIRTAARHAKDWQTLSALDQEAGTGFLTKEGRFAATGSFPSPEAYQDFMNRIANAGIPYANLGATERMVTSSLARTATGSVTAGKTAQVFGDVFPVPEFFAVEQPMVFKSGRLALPADLLKQAGLATDDEMYRLSPFMNREVSANFQFSPDPEEAQSQIETLMNYLKNKGDIDPGVLESLDKLDSESLQKYGVQVGTLTEGAKGDEISMKVNRSLRYAMGGLDVDAADSNAAHYAVGIVQNGDKKFTTGAAVIEKGMDEAARSSYFANAKVAARYFQQVDSSAIARNLVNIGQSSYATKAFDAAKNLKNFYTHNTRLSQASIASAAALTGYYFFKRHKKKAAYYDDPFQPQPTEPQDWYTSYQQEVSSGSPPISINSPNPLSTAGLVAALDRTKIGHTIMGPNKHSHLFGV
jgi:hypothetical protein